MSCKALLDGQGLENVQKVMSLLCLKSNEKETNIRFNGTTKQGAPVLADYIESEKNHELGKST